MLIVCINTFNVEFKKKEENGLTLDNNIHKPRKINERYNIYCIFEQNTLRGIMKLKYFCIINYYV